MIKIRFLFSSHPKLFLPIRVRRVALIRQDACAVVSVRAGAVRWQPEAPHVVGEFAGGEAVNAAVHGDFVYVHGVGLPVERVMDTDAFARVRPFVGKYVHAEEEAFLADGGGYVLKVR